jgi:hypothetical protein
MLGSLVAMILYAAIGFWLLKTMLPGVLAQAMAHPHAHRPVLTEAMIPKNVRWMENWVVFFFLFAQQLWQTSMMNLAVKQVDGEDVTLGDVCNMRGRWWAALFSAALVALFLCAPPYCREVLSTGVTEDAKAVWTIASRVVSVLFAALFAFVGPLVVDRRMGALKAMWESCKASASWILVACAFLFVVQYLSVLGFALCFVGILFTYGLMPLGIAVNYRRYFSGALMPPVKKHVW